MEEYKPIWHIRIVNNIRQFHPSYRELSEEEIKTIPDEYWYTDPIHLIKPENKTKYQVINNLTKHN